MKVTFVYFGSENLGIEYLSSFLKKYGIETSLVFDPGLFNDKYQLDIKILNSVFNSTKPVVKEIINQKPDIVAFSVIRDLYPWAKRISYELKKKTDIPIVFGGVHASNIPEIIMEDENIDYIIRGEGEEALLELVNAMSDADSDLSNIPNLVFRAGSDICFNKMKPFTEDLDSFPYPDKELFKKFTGLDSTYNVITARGCPYKCTFCSANSLCSLQEGPYLRRRSYANVINELVLMKEKYNFSEINFVDDVFTYDMNWLKDFLPDYKEKINLPYRCLSHPKFFTEEIALLLKDSGCIRLRLSPQTMNQKIRQQILKRPETDREIIDAFEICEKTRIPFTTDRIFGLPGETENDYFNEIGIYSKYSYLKKIKCYFLAFFPKTEIIDLALESGILNNDDIDIINEGTNDLYYNSSIFLKRNKKKYLSAKKYEFIFRLLPIIPLPLRKILSGKLFISLSRFMPMWITTIIRLLVGIKNKDTALKPYIKYYLKNFKNYFSKEYSSD